MGEQWGTGRWELHTHGSWSATPGNLTPARLEVQTVGAQGPRRPLSSLSGAERDAAARAGTRAQCGRRGGTRRSQALLVLSVCRSLPRAGASFPLHGRPHSVCSTVTLLLGVHWLQRTQSLKALGQGHGQWGPSWCPPTLHLVGSPLDSESGRVLGWPLAHSCLCCQTS